MAFSLRKVFGSRSTKKRGRNVKSTSRGVAEEPEDALEADLESADPDVVTELDESDFEEISDLAAEETSNLAPLASAAPAVAEPPPLPEPAAAPAGDGDTKEGQFAELDTGGEGPFPKVIRAIDRVSETVEVNSERVKQTVREVSSEQNSVIQGIYRLINERTMDRNGLNHRRREVWKALNESLGEIRSELTGLNESFRSGAGAPDSGTLESLIADLRTENRGAAERVEAAIADLRDEHWKRIESMVSELRAAERERVDNVLSVLRDESAKRLTDNAKAGDVRVFDAIRSGDTRVTTQKEIMRRKVSELEEIYQERATHLEEVYQQQIEGLRKEIEAGEERYRERRKKLLLQLVSFFDTLDHRLKAAHVEHARREKDRLPDVLSLPDPQERRLSWVSRVLGKRDFERFEAERANLESRLHILDKDVLEVHKTRLEALEDLRGLLLITLKVEGVEPFSSLGEAFQSERHVLVEEVSAKPGQEPGKIIAVRRCGYLVDGGILRPAEVVVSV